MKPWLLSKSSTRQEERISANSVLEKISANLESISWLRIVIMEQMWACLQEEKFINYGSALNITSIEHGSKQVTSDKGKLFGNTHQGYDS